MAQVNLVASTWKAVVALLLLLRPASVHNAVEKDVTSCLSTWHPRNCVYNRTWALHIVEYASAVYIEDSARLWSWTCSRCHGLTKGFKLEALVKDEPHCLQAYVGVAEDLKSIIVAFRGTQESSYQNWAEDLYFRHLDLNYPGLDNAMVHKGFYQAYHNTTLRDGLVEPILRILKYRSELGVVVTGHSMGGALATFCALDLTVNFGIKNLRVMTFGQPRVGNNLFAAAFGALVPNTIRMTHSHDIVPHLPPYYPILREHSYHHFATEVWIYKIQLGRLQWEFERVCDNSGEDSSCSRSVIGNSIADHMEYLGVPLNTIPE